MLQSWNKNMQKLFLHFSGGRRMNQEGEYATHPDWANLASPSLRPEHRLIGSIVLNAMAEYFILKRMGAVRYMELTGYWQQRSDNSYTYRDMTASDVHRLILFFKKDAARVLKIIGWDLAPLEVYNAVLRLEKSGAYRRMFSQGVQEEQGIHRVARKRKKRARV